MEVKTGMLRDNLSRYLKRVRQTGESIVILDRDVPVAEIRPYQKSQEDDLKSVWSLRSRFEAHAGALDEDFELPERHTDRTKQVSPLE